MSDQTVYEQLKKHDYNLLGNKRYYIETKILGIEKTFVDNKEKGFAKKTRHSKGRLSNIYSIYNDVKIACAKPFVY